MLLLNDRIKLILSNLIKMYGDLDLVILCGGRGSRIKNYIKNTPKPLIKVSNISILEKIINFYQKFDFKTIYLLAGYKGEMIKKKFDNKFFNFIKCKVIVEKKEMGTGGSISVLKKKINSNFLVVNGDSYIDYDFLKFVKINKKNFFAKMLITKNNNYKSNKKLSNLSLKKNKIYSSQSSNYMNAGIYLFNKKIFELIKPNYQSLEEDILPYLIERKFVYGEKFNGEFIDVGTYKNLKHSRNQFFKKKNTAVFLDRDGVINYDLGYVVKFKKFKWTKNIFSTLRYINKKKNYLFIITNQSGIARKYYTIDEFFDLHTKIKKFLLKKKIFIDEVFFCPHHPNYGSKKFKKKCRCRKPGNLLLEKAIFKWDIDRNKSLMVGDKISDFKCAEKSKLKFFYKSENFLRQMKNII
jgi:D-glycero-D-manno-heptose 1,7-bisphosphate phosphatase